MMRRSERGRVVLLGLAAVAIGSTATTRVLTSGGSLNGPLGLTLAPGGDLIAVNGNDGKAVEITPADLQVAAVTLVPRGAGDLFGVTTPPDGRGLLFVNDGTNALDLFSG
jgi:hypothetical protein